MARRKKKKWMQEMDIKEGAYTNWIKDVERKHRVRIFNKDGTIPVTFSRKICDAKKNEITWHGKKIRFSDTTRRRACLHIKYYEANKNKKKSRRKKK